MARRVRRWLDGVRDPWEAFSDFLEVFSQFSLKTGHFRKAYRMYSKPTGFPINLEDTTERKMEGVGGEERLREGARWVE